ncbi:MAG: cyclase family protein [Verrucomicrobiota bacterium]|jgi:kynurenine formamidase|nr:cyclase family protein [Verrucomicrobiota bacterium]
MCSPNVIEKVRQRISRRDLLKTTATAAAGVLAAGCQSTAKAKAAPATEPISFTRVVDLSHTLHPDFPAWFVPGEEKAFGTKTFLPPAIVEVERVFKYEEIQINLNKVSYWEHVGTHMDAPNHFSEGSSVEKIPAEDLVLPLAVIDIKAKAARDPLAQVTLEDVKAWENKNGRIPERACLAMNSGWAHHVNTPKFKSPNADGAHQQPAFHIDAIKFIMEERNVVSIAVDTFSFDNLHSPEYDVHYAWLGDERWGIEVVNNLDDVPAVGATIVVGQPKIQGGTGGPNRVMALV